MIKIHNENIESNYDTFFDLERSANTLTGFIDRVVDVLESSDDTSDRDVRETIIYFDKLYDQLFRYLGKLGD